VRYINTATEEQAEAWKIPFSDQYVTLRGLVLGRASAAEWERDWTPVADRRVIDRRDRMRGTPERRWSSRAMTRNEMSEWVPR
jgi:hypothetical protein